MTMASPPKVPSADSIDVNEQGRNCRAVLIDFPAGGGEIMTMASPPKVPSADSIDVNEQGKIVGLF